MSERKPSIFGSQAPDADLGALDRALGSSAGHRPSIWRSAWRAALIVVPAIGTLLTVGFFLWVNLGHLYLPARFTFPVLFGQRQGLTTAETEKAAASGKAAANNIFNNETALSEARKQAVGIEETTAARAALEARTQAETIRETAELRATAECIRDLRTAAARRRAECYGTGTAGGECDARGDVIAQLEEGCGSLALSSDIEAKGTTP